VCQPPMYMPERASTRDVANFPWVCSAPIFHPDPYFLAVVDRHTFMQSGYQSWEPRKQALTSGMATFALRGVMVRDSRLLRCTTIRANPRGRKSHHVLKS
jgi:hypothetical protein